MPEPREKPSTVEALQGAARTFFRDLAMAVGIAATLSAAGWFVLDLKYATKEDVVAVKDALVEAEKAHTKERTALRERVIKLESAKERHSKALDKIESSLKGLAKTVGEIHTEVVKQNERHRNKRRPR